MSDILEAVNLTWQPVRVQAGDAHRRGDPLRVPVHDDELVRARLRPHRAGGVAPWIRELRDARRGAL